MANRTSSEVLLMYRRLLRLAARLPQAQGQEALHRIRNEFRSHKSEANPAKLADLIAEANGKLGYLRMIVPRHQSDVPPGAIGRNSFVSIGGKLVPSDGQISDATAAVKASQLDSNDIKRHQANLRRFQYMDRPTGVPKSPFR
jgi:hypothetical protein